MHGKPPRIFARVTQYYDSASGNYKWCSEHEPMWVTGLTTDDEDLAEGEFDDDDVIVAPLCPADKWVTITVARSHDEFTLVPYDELPDEVVAEFVRRSLMGHKWQGD